MGHSIPKCTFLDRRKVQDIPGVKVRDAFDASEATDNLNLVADNVSNMLYEGWVEITFNLAPLANKSFLYSF